MSHISPPPPFIRTVQRLRVAFWRRRVARGIIRAVWLTLLVPLGVMGGYLWFGWQISWFEWMLAALAVGGAALLWAVRPLNLKKMVHRLDDLLEARARLITAFEVSQSVGQIMSPTPNPVAGQLLQDAVALSINMRRQITMFNRGFWLEMRALIAVATLLGAMLLIDALTPNVPNATPINLPPAGQEPRANEVIPPDARLFPPPFQPPAQLSQEQIQAALEALSDALRDQAVTRAAAEAIDQGDLDSAAESLRRLADQLEGLSEESHRKLGEALQEAESNTGQNVPGFSEPLQRGSQALERGDVAAGSRALSELAATLDSIEIGERPAEPDEVGGEPPAEAEPPPGEEPSDEETAGDEEESGGDEGEGDQPLNEETGRLPIDAQPLELESEPEQDDTVLQPAELNAQSGEERTTDSPFARRSFGPSDNDLGADPLIYPWEKREIVKEYFTH